MVMSWIWGTVLSQGYWEPIIKIYWGPDFKRGTEELFWPRGTENFDIKTCSEPKVLKNALQKFWTRIWRPVTGGGGTVQNQGYWADPRGQKTCLNPGGTNLTQIFIWFSDFKNWIWRHVSYELTMISVLSGLILCPSGIGIS